MGLGTRTRRRQHAAVIAALATLLAAATAVGASTNGGSPRPSNKAIRIATVTAIESETLGLPHVGESAQAAVKGINAHGGIDGRPLKVEICDDHNQANDAIACGREIAGDADILSVVGTSTLFGDDLLPILAAADVPAVGVFPAGITAYTSPVSFPISGGAFTLFLGLGQAVVDGGFEKVSIVYLDAAEVASLLDGMTESIETAGIEIVAEVPVSATATDLTPAITRALEGDTEAVVIALAETQYDLAVQGIFQLGGSDVRAIAPAADPAVLDRLGDATSILSLVDSFPPPTAKRVPAIRQMNADFRRYAPGIQRDLASKNAWASVQLFAYVAGRLADKGQPIDRANVLAELGTLSAYDTKGLTPVIDFSTPGEPLPRLFNNSVTFVRFKNGKLVGSGTFVDASTGEELPASP